MSKLNAINDRAAIEDQLGVKIYQESLVKFIEGAEMPLTIAIQGEWGSGKTSLMEKVKNDLSQNFYPVWVNVWQYSFCENKKDILTNISSNIINQIASHAKNPEIKKNIEHLKKFVRFAINSTAKTIIKSTIQLDVGNVFEDQETKDIEEIRDEIEKLTKEILEDKNASDKKGFVIFIDDLDRMEPVISVNLLEIFKTLFDINNCIFLLAIDYDVVKKGLVNKFGEYTLAKEHEFRSFFDKIIQVPFFMPVSKYEVDPYIKGILENANLSNSETENKFIMDCIKAITGLNPRSIKKILNYYSLNRIMLSRSHISQDEQLRKMHFLLVCIQVEFPLVYSAIESNSDIRTWTSDVLDSIDITYEESDLENSDDTEWEIILKRICIETRESYSKTEGLCKILSTHIAPLEQQVNTDLIKKLLKITSVTDIQSKSIKQISRTRSKWIVMAHNDSTKFECSSMGDVAFKVIDDYIKFNKVNQYSVLQSTFKYSSFKQPLIAESSKISDDMNRGNTNGISRKKNYYSASRGFLKVGDTEFGVSTQWVAEKNASALYFQDFIDLVRDLGYIVKPLDYTEL